MTDHHPDDASHPSPPSTPPTSTAPSTGPASSTSAAPSIPSLDALGDELEAAAARAGGRGGTMVPITRRPPLWLPVAAGFLALVLAASVVLAISRTGSSTAEAAVTGAMQRSSTLDTGRFAMDLSLGSGPSASVVHADGVFDAGRGQSQITLAFGGGNAQVVLDRGTVELQLPGEGWVRVGAAPGAGSPSSAPTVPPDLGDPSGLFDLFHGVEGVSEVGHETIDGVPTTHYRGSIDLARAFADLAAADAGRAAGSLGFLGHTVPQSGRLPLDVWVADDGTIRRLDTTIDLGDLAASAPSIGLGSVPTGIAGPATASITFRDLGAPVTVTVPDPATVTDVPGPR